MRPEGGRRRRRALGWVAAALGAAVLTAPGLPSTAATDAAAEHVVVLIGPGISSTDVGAARTYAAGEDGELPGIDAAVASDDAALLSFAVDTGTGTPVSGPEASPLERARRAGLATGLVTAGPVADSSAALGALTVGVAACTDPPATSAICPSDAREGGGAGSAAEQLIDLRPEVVLGGGAAIFDSAATVGVWGDVTLREQAAARGYAVVDDTDAMHRVDSADQHRPVLGLFAPGALDVGASGRLDPDGRGGCDATAAPASTPTLAEMTAQATALLERHDRSYLQVVGTPLSDRRGYVDECRRIAATLAFDEAVQEALASAEPGTTRVVVVLGQVDASSDVVAERVSRLLGLDG